MEVKERIMLVKVLHMIWDRDAFIPPKPFPWTLDEDTCDWEAPVAHQLW